MAGISLKSDAALRAEDKRLLTRDWIDSNARKSKHPRSGPSWDHPKDWTKSKSRTLKTNDCEDDGENAGVKVRFWPSPSHIHNDVATVATQADGASRSWAVTDRRKRECLQ